LYRAKSIRELKEEVFIYEKMKGKGNSKDHFNRESTGKQTQSNFLRNASSVTAKAILLRIARAK